MRYYAFPLILTLLLGLFATGCDLSGAGDEVTLSGRVLDAATGDPITDALVTIAIPGEESEPTAVTDAGGRFSINIDVDDAMDVTLTASDKEGRSVQQSLRVSADLNPITDLRLRINRGTEEERTPGKPTNIFFSSQSTDVVRVKESGGVEIARLTFQVVDSTGQPIDIDEQVEVRFRLGQEPGGDAALTPDRVLTDGNGEATVNLSSGTTAGVVQVVAETEGGDGATLRSKPVRVTIHGGLPNQCHFSLGPEQFNFPGLTKFGLTNPVNVIVGDRYGNPVVPGTAVYFTTNAGVIEGSIQTNGQGRGSANLISAEPLPDGGIATIRAETAGTDAENALVAPSNCDAAELQPGNENEILSQIPIVFSGRKQVAVSPGEALLNQTYTLVVADVQNGNPLAEGTQITVAAEGNEVLATGNTNIELDDTAFLDQNGDGDIFDPEDIVRGPGVTEFTFRVVEDPEPDNPEPSELGAISINVNSPNGSFEIVLTPPDVADGAGASKARGSAYGTVRATNDAIVNDRGGSIVVQAPPIE